MPHCMFRFCPDQNSLAPACCCKVIWVLVLPLVSLHGEPAVCQELFLFLSKRNPKSLMRPSPKWLCSSFTKRPRLQQPRVIGGSNSCSLVLCQQQQSVQKPCGLVNWSWNPGSLFSKPCGAAVSLPWCWENVWHLDTVGLSLCCTRINVNQ